MLEKLQVDSTVEHVLLGDSHLKKSISTLNLTSTVNYSLRGANYEFTFFRMRNIIDRCDNLKSITLSADFNQFTEKTNNLNLIGSSFFKGTSFRNFLKHGYLTFESINNFIITKYMPYIDWKNRFKFFRYAHRNQKGNQIKDISKFTDQENLEESAIFFNQLILSDSGLYDERNLYYFEKCLQLCEENNVQVHILIHPLCSYLNTHIDKYYKENTEEAVAIWQIVNKYKNCTLHDFRKDLLDNSNFTDCDHLNEKGNKAFTEIYLKTIQN